MNNDLTANNNNNNNNTRLLPHRTSPRPSQQPKESGPPGPPGTGPRPALCIRRAALLGGSLCAGLDGSLRQHADAAAAAAARTHRLFLLLLLFLRVHAELLRGQRELHAPPEPGGQHVPGASSLNTQHVLLQMASTVRWTIEKIPHIHSPKGLDTLEMRLN